MLEKWTIFSGWMWEIVGIPESTRETEVCELIEKFNCVNANQDRLESCQLLPSDKKNKFIVKFSWRKDGVLRNKNKNKNFNPWSIDIDNNKVYINESLCG